MIYHDEDKCREAGGDKFREFGWPVRCTQAWSDGALDYQCPSCGRIWLGADQDEKLPDTHEEES